MHLHYIGPLVHLTYFGPLVHLNYFGPLVHLNYFGPLEDLIGNKVSEMWGLVLHFCKFKTSFKASWSSTKLLTISLMPINCSLFDCFAFSGDFHAF